MAICPKCKAENRPEAAFCVRCGAILFSQPAPVKTALPDTPRTEPIQPLAGEPPVFLTGFPKRPEGSVFGERFRYDALIDQGQHEIHYTVTDICPAPAVCVHICSNPECRTIHIPIGSDQEKYCTQCGERLEENPPLLLLKEADSDQFSEQQQVIDLHLAHPNIHPPITQFQQELPGGMRYCLVTPYSQDLPSHPEISSVLEWGLQLAGGLDYLHAHGAVFGEELDPSSIGLAEKQAVWRNFSAVRILPLLADRDKINDVRLLALTLYSSITGKSTYSDDPSLAPGLNELFHQALVGEGFTSGAALAQKIDQLIKSGISPINLDYHIGRRTHPGKMRTKNEDSILSFTLSRILQGISQPAGLFAIADGMGGHATGELASSLAIQAIIKKVFSELPSLQDLTFEEYTSWLNQAVQTANLAVYESRQNAGNDMGSTLICVLLLGTQAYFAHLGDSRIYLLREDSIQQLTADHSLVQQLVNIGQISADEARYHPQRNVIYRSLGDKQQVEPDIITQNVAPGDKLLLCSDGLSGMLDDQTIKKIILESSSPQAACNRLIDAANLAGGEDNISAILIEVVLA